MTNIEAFQKFLSVQSAVWNPNEEASRVMNRGCARISITSNTEEFYCKTKKNYDCKVILQTSDQYQNALCGTCILFWEKTANWSSISKSVESPSRKETILYSMECPRLQDEFTQLETWPYKELALMIVLFNSGGCGQSCTRSWGVTRWCEQCEQICQDHNDSTTANDRNPSRQETG